MDTKITIGDRVTFDTDMLELFIEETNSDNKELQQYQKLVLAGVDQVGVVKEVGHPMTTVAYSDGWNLPVPNKYLVILPPVE